MATVRVIGAHLKYGKKTDLDANVNLRIEESSLVIDGNSIHETYNDYQGKSYFNDGTPLELRIPLHDQQAVKLITELTKFLASK